LSHRADRPRDLVADVADRDRAWNAFEAATRADQATYTPGFATMTAVEAIQACKDAGKAGPALEACVRAATDPRLFLRDR
jgi:hypothetical protein